MPRLTHFMLLTLFVAGCGGGIEIREIDDATGFIAWLGNRLIEVPTRLQETSTRVREKLKIPGLGRATSGIDALAPDNLVQREIADWDLPEGLPAHSIIGNNEAADTPGGTDGFVTYESSHLDGVESEKIILAGHNVQTTAEAILELRRILHLHVSGEGKAP